MFTVALLRSTIALLRGALSTMSARPQSAVEKVECNLL